MRKKVNSEKTPQWFKDFRDDSEIEKRQSSILTNQQSIFTKLEDFERTQAVAAEKMEGVVQQLKNLNSKETKIILSLIGVIASQFAVKVLGSPLLDDITAFTLMFSLVFIVGFMALKWNKMPNIFRLFLGVNVFIIAWRFLDLFLDMPYVPPGLFGVPASLVAIVIVWKMDKWLH